MDGYFTMPYQYCVDRNLSDDFWTIRRAENRWRADVAQWLNRIIFVALLIFPRLLSAQAQPQAADTMLSSSRDTFQYYFYKNYNFGTQAKYNPVIFLSTEDSGLAIQQ